MTVLKCSLNPSWRQRVGRQLCCHVTRVNEERNSENTSSGWKASFVSPRSRPTQALSLTFCGVLIPGAWENCSSGFDGVFFLFFRRLCQVRRRQDPCKVMEQHRTRMRVGCSVRRPRAKSVRFKAWLRCLCMEVFPSQQLHKSSADSDVTRNCGWSRRWTCFLAEEDLQTR